MKSASSFAGRPGFARLKPPRRPVPKETPETIAARKRSAAICALNGFAKEYLRRNGPEDARYLDMDRLSAAAALRFRWWLPLRGFFDVTIEEHSLALGGRYLEEAADSIASAMRASFELAGSGFVEGAGELL